MKKEITLPAIIAFIAFIVALFMHYIKFDIQVYSLANSTCTGYCVKISELITHLGDGWLQIILCIILGIWYYKQTNYNLSKVWFYAIPLALIAGAIGQIVKFTFGRPRPKLLPEYYDFQWFEFAGSMRGFPSGHTLTSFAIVAIVASNYGTKGKIVLFTLASLIGISRITTNAHFSADVVFGAALGYLLGVVLKNIILDKKLKKLKTGNKND